MGLTVSDVIEGITMGKLECLRNILSAEEALGNDAEIVINIVIVKVTGRVAVGMSQGTHDDCGWEAERPDLLTPKPRSMCDVCCDGENQDRLVH